MNAVIRNGFLWTCQAIGLSTNDTYVGNSSGSNVTRSAIQWFKLQISPDSTTLTLADYGRIYDTNQTANPWWYYMPSLMVNCAGDMLAGFSGSSSITNISALYTWGLPGGFTLNPPRAFQSGTTAPTPPRWGDYSATTLDPTDDWTFWTVQEYAKPNGTNPLWGTVIARIRPNP